MNKLLHALGYSPNLFWKLCLCGLFGVMTFVLFAGWYLTFLLGFDPLVTHSLGWAIWFTWQGILFPFNRQRYLKEDRTTSYKRAFFSDILFGLSFWITQIVRPCVVGILMLKGPLAPTGVWIGAAIFIGLGSLLLYLGFKTIGFDGAGFLYEFESNPSPVTKESIYSLIRHPLFLGGVLVSVGASLPFFLSAGWLAIVNLVILPLYTRIEDWRGVRVNGSRHREYIKTVGSFIPKPAEVRKALDRVGRYIRSGD